MNGAMEIAARGGAEFHRLSIDSIVSKTKLHGFYKTDLLVTKEAIEQLEFIGKSHITPFPGTHRIPQIQAFPKFQSRADN